MLEKQKYVEELVIKHEDIKRRYSLAVRNTEEVCGKMENQYSIISTLEKKVQILEEKIYGDNESLKNKYKNNFADRNFYKNIILLPYRLRSYLPHPDALLFQDCL